MLNSSHSHRIRWLNRSPNRGSTAWHNAFNPGTSNTGSSYRRNLFLHFGLILPKSFWAKKCQDKKFVMIELRRSVAVVPAEFFIFVWVCGCVLRERAKKRVCVARWLKKEKGAVVLCTVCSAHSKVHLRTMIGWLAGWMFCRSVVRSAGNRLLLTKRNWT